MLILSSITVIIIAIILNVAATNIPFQGYFLSQVGKQVWGYEPSGVIRRAWHAGYGGERDLKRTLDSRGELFLMFVRRMQRARPVLAPGHSLFYT